MVGALLQRAVDTVGSHKFLPLIYQLAARMSQSSTSFQTVLRQVCLLPPTHTISCYDTYTSNWWYLSSIPQVNIVNSQSSCEWVVKEKRLTSGDPSRGCVPVVIHISHYRCYELQLPRIVFPVAEKLPLYPWASLWAVEHDNVRMTLI